MMPRVWRYGLVYFCILVGLYGFSFWLPQIISSLGHMTNVQVGLVTMIPYTLACIALVLWGTAFRRHRRAFLACRLAFAARCRCADRQRLVERARHWHSLRFAWRPLESTQACPRSGHWQAVDCKARPPPAPLR